MCTVIFCFASKKINNNNLLLVFQPRLCIKAVLCSAQQITEEAAKLRPSGLCGEIKRLQGSGNHGGRGA